jgi:hypothetical protein
VTIKSLVLALASSIVLAACATAATEPTTSNGAANGSSEEKVYTTGSNIPRGNRPKGSVTEMSKEDMERARDQARANTGRGPGG